MPGSRHPIVARHDGGRSDQRRGEQNQDKWSGLIIISTGIKTGATQVKIMALI